MLLILSLTEQHKPYHILVQNTLRSHYRYSLMPTFFDADSDNKAKTPAYCTRSASQSDEMDTKTIKPDTDKSTAATSFASAWSLSSTSTSTTSQQQRQRRQSPHHRTLTKFLTGTRRKFLMASTQIQTRGWLTSNDMSHVANLRSTTNWRFSRCSSKERR